MATTDNACMIKLPRPSERQILLLAISLFSVRTALK